ncbi:glycosyl transferase family 2 [Nonlabens sp. MIC269]|uniref:glycosyltransferase family 2 protein n=1 Tax=Nonlabens sp. MIC269 TaxID=1476901 RepID=UPI00071EC2BB|nr:glycosyltransferase family 2 protein [Nonlabens sp. MIC269]ALM20953.1 glycosyl transferase family 2 [Nonlabens sp. MIC269]
MDLVSVIIPTYNNQDTLGETLDSVLNQDYRPIELIIVDDCSVDDSHAFAKAYSTKNSSQEISFIIQENKENKGAGFTRNRAVELANGRYIAFLDADDLWKPYKLSLQIEQMRLSQVAMSYGAYEIFTENASEPKYLQKVFNSLTYKKLLRANYVGNLTGIYDTHKIGKVVVSSLRKRQDWAMWLDVIKLSGTAIGIEKPIASYRTGNGLSSRKSSLIKYNYAVYRNHLNYSFLKSCWSMMLFIYEQWFIKKALIKKLD